MWQPFRCAGYYYDPETNLYYLKSRYYSPDLGRFLTRDDHKYIKDKDPQTLNLYTYVGNDPVGNTDPAGNTAWTNIVFLLGWATGTLNTDYWSDIYYNPDSVETTEMKKSPGAARLRAAFYAGGGKNITGFEYGTWTAYNETVKVRLYSSTATQVGGFANAKAINNGDGTVTFIIPNVAGWNSFLGHKVPNSPLTWGPGHNILQIFYWTEAIQNK